MGLANFLYQVFQKKTQDIVSALNFVENTKSQFQDMRAHGWDDLFMSVVSFCEQHGIDVPDMSSRYMMSTRHCMFRELNDRFPEQTIELLILSSALDPRNSFKSFNIGHLCKLAEKFYPADFSLSDLKGLEIELRLIQLVLTLPVSTATTKRAFSCMRMIKNRLRSTIADEFLADCMILHIEREFANSIDNEEIIEEFKISKPCIMGKTHYVPPD
ncbi:unnamed protein product [Prunus armeniaca]